MCFDALDMRARSFQGSIVQKRSRGARQTLSTSKDSYSNNRVFAARQNKKLRERKEKNMFRQKSILGLGCILNT